MGTMVYQWSNNRYKADPAKVGAEVEAIIAEEGVCTPRAFRTRTVEMRDYFRQWTQEELADMALDHKARQVLHSLTVVQVSDKRTQEAPAFLSVNVAPAYRGPTEVTEDGEEPGKRGYLSVSQVVSNDIQREQALAEVRAKLNGLRRRYRHIQEFQPVWDAIERIDAA